MKVSVVAPVYNEEKILPEFCRRTAVALHSTGLDWEIVLVNDGSRDRSRELIRQLHAEETRIKLVDLSRNFGHQAAFTAGLHHASGDCVVLIDSDLQDPPEVIPAMVEQWRQGHAIVLGERRSRAETGLRGAALRLFYPVFDNLTELPGGLTAGNFSLMDRRVVRYLNELPERQRFLPGLRTWLGFSPTKVLYDRQERAAGKPGMSLPRLLRYGLDAVFSFSYKPLRLATIMGAVISLTSLIAALVYAASYFFQSNPPPRGFTTVLLAVLFLGGANLSCLGIVGEYIGRMYEELKQRPLYVVQERLGIDLRNSLSDLPDPKDRLAKAEAC